MQCKICEKEIKDLQPYYEIIKHKGKWINDFINRLLNKNATYYHKNCLESVNFIEINGKEYVVNENE